MDERFDILGTAVTSMSLSIISGLGFLLNLSVIFTYVMSYKARNTTPLETLTYQFAVANFGNSILSIMSSFTAIYGDWIFGNELCQMYGFLSTLFDFVEIFTIMIYLTLKVNMHKDTWNYVKMGRRRISILFHFLWAVATIYAALPFLGLSRYEVDKSRFICTIYWNGKKTFVESVTIIVLKWVIAIILPVFFGLCLWLYMYIYPISQQDQKLFKSIFFWPLIVVIPFNLICRLPYLSAVSFGDVDDNNPYWTIELVASFTILQKILLLVHPIATWRYNKEFRNEWLKLLRYCYGLLMSFIWIEDNPYSFPFKKEPTPIINIHENMFNCHDIEPLTSRDLKLYDYIIETLGKSLNLLDGSKKYGYVMLRDEEDESMEIVIFKKLNLPDEEWSGLRIGETFDCEVYTFQRDSNMSSPYYSSSQNTDDIPIRGLGLDNMGTPASEPITFPLSRPAPNVSRFYEQRSRSVEE